MFNTSKDFLNHEIIKRKQQNCQEFSEICTTHNIEKLLEFVSSPKYNDVNINSGFIIVCLNYSVNRSKIINIFLTNKKLKKDLDLQSVYQHFVANNHLDYMLEFDYIVNKTNDLIESYLKIATTNNQIATLEFLIKQNHVSKELLYSSLFIASQLGYTNIVKYLLEQQELDIHAQYDLVLRKAGANRHVDIVKYLLTSSTLKEKANPYALQDDLLITATMHNDKQLLNYLYNEYAIVESDRVKDYKESKVVQGV